MKNIFLIIFLLALVLFSKFIYSIEIDIKKDLTLLNKNDQDFFLKKCKNDLEVLESPKCLNYIGIKLFLFSYKNKSFSVSDKDSLYKKSINYLEIASQKGSKQAFKNLGWIYSNNKLSFFDLKKSSLYFSSSVKSNILIKKPLKKNNNLKKTNTSVNYSNIILAITLIKKLEIYFEATKNKKDKYLTLSQFNGAQKSFNNIIEKKKIGKVKLVELENKVLENNLVIFSFLQEDIKVFNKENLKLANDALNKLNFILKN